ncbi:uncharacterized protein [Rutidosis leptorrhynchoides]|uniref:uncharacterized protein n=1 Tax=Rutidosis leptorrhynchoides TaxID=125765 RepID=UPI003A98EBF7
MDDTRKFSLKDKIKQYFCFSCCFTANRHETLHSDSPISFSNNNNNRLNFSMGASSQWIKSHASIDIPEIKDKCRNMFGGKNHRRRRSSTDFKYDPLSYALNFEEDSSVYHEDEEPLKDFSSRLPLSPSRKSTVSIN